MATYRYRTMTTDKAGGADSAPNDGEQSDTDSLADAIQRASMIEDVLESGFNDQALDLLETLREDLDRVHSERTVDLRVDRLGSESEIRTLEQGDEIVSDGPIAVTLPGGRDE